MNRLTDHLSLCEREFIRKALVNSNGVIREAAKWMGLTRPELLKKVAEHGLAEAARKMRRAADAGSRPDRHVRAEEF